MSGQTPMAVTVAVAAGALLAIAAVVVIAAVAAAAGKRAKGCNDRAFAQAVSALAPRVLEFYGRPHAAALVLGRRTILTVAPRTQGDLGPVLPGRGNLSIVARTKLRGTGGRHLYLAVLPEASAGAGIARSVAGWQSPEPGMFVGRLPKHSMEDSLADFGLLGTGTKAGLRALAGRHGRVAVSPDWTSVMIGRASSLELLGGDEAALAELELSVSFAFESPAEELRAGLESVAGTAGLLEMDLGT